MAEHKFDTEALGFGSVLATAFNKNAKVVNPYRGRPELRAKTPAEVERESPQAWALVDKFFLQG